MALLAGQEALLDTDRDTYARTHPHSRDRLATIERALATAPARDALPPPHLAAGFARLRAKLTAIYNPRPRSAAAIRATRASRAMPAPSPPIARTKPPTLWPRSTG